MQVGDGQAAKFIAASHDKVHKSDAGVRNVRMPGIRISDLCESVSFYQPTPVMTTAS